MPNLPIALNIENYHQGAKILEFELDEKGNIKKEFFDKKRNV